MKTKQLLVILTSIFISCNQRPDVTYTNKQLEKSYAIPKDSNSVWRANHKYYIVKTLRDSIDSLNRPCCYVQMQYALDETYSLITWPDCNDLILNDTFYVGATDNQLILVRPVKKN